MRVVGGGSYYILQKKHVTFLKILVWIKYCLIWFLKMLIIKKLFNKSQGVRAKKIKTNWKKRVLVLVVGGGEALLHEWIVNSVFFYTKNLTALKDIIPTMWGAGGPLDWCMSYKYVLLLCVFDKLLKKKIIVTMSCYYYLVLIVIDIDNNDNKRLVCNYVFLKFPKI